MWSRASASFLLLTLVFAMGLSPAAEAQYSLQVSRVSPAATFFMDKNSSRSDVQVQVSNQGSLEVTIYPSCQPSGIACSINSPNHLPFTLAPYQSRTVSMTVTTGQGDLSHFIFKAEAWGAVEGGGGIQSPPGEGDPELLASGQVRWDVDTRPPYAFDLSSSVPSASRTHGQTNQSFTFTIDNIGASSDTYTWSCLDQGSVSCANPSSGTTGEGTVTVKANMGSVGTSGQVGIQVTSQGQPGLTKTSWTSINLSPPAGAYPLALSRVTSGTTIHVLSGQNTTVRFKVENNGPSDAVIFPRCPLGGGGVICDVLSPSSSNFNLASGATRNIDVRVTGGSADLGSIDFSVEAYAGESGDPDMIQPNGEPHLATKSKSYTVDTRPPYRMEVVATPATASVENGVTNRQFGFSVKNTGRNADSYHWQCLGNQGSSCTGSTSGNTGTLAYNQSQPAAVRANMPAGGTQTRVGLRVVSNGSGSVAQEAWVTISLTTPQNPGFNVLPTGGSGETIYEPRNTTQTAVFTLDNGDLNVTVLPSCISGTGITGCTIISPASTAIPMAARTTQAVTVRFNIGAVDFGEVKLRAVARKGLQDPNAPNPQGELIATVDGAYQIDTRPAYGVNVTRTASSVTVNRGRANRSFSFDVENEGIQNDQVRLTCVTTGNASCDSSAPFVISLLKGAKQRVTVRADMGTTGSSTATVGLSAVSLGDPSFSDSDATNVRLVVPAGNATINWDGGAGFWLAHDATGKTAQFRVTTDYRTVATLSCDDDANPTVICDNTTVSPGVVAAGQTNALVTVTIRGTGVVGPDSVALKASRKVYNLDDGRTASTGSGHFTVYSVDPILSAAAGNPAVLAPSEVDTVRFTLASAGDRVQPYDLSVSWAQGTATILGPTTVNASQATPATVEVEVTAGLEGSAPVQLTASTTYDGGSGSVTAPHTLAVEEPPTYGPYTLVADANVVNGNWNASDSVAFTVQYQGTAADPATVAITCTGLTACPETSWFRESGSNSKTFTAGLSDQVWVYYETGMLDGQIVAEITGTQFSASASVSIRVPDDYGLSILDTRPGGRVDRSECLTVSAGPVDIQCDDVRFVYSAPAVTVMNQTRATRLIYNSGLVAGRIQVPVDLTFGEGQTADSVRTVLMLNGVMVDDVTRGLGGHQPGQPVRVLALHEDPSLATGLYPITIETTVWYDGLGAVRSVSDVVPVVNWASSEVGPGWNHSLGERLHYEEDMDRTILLVGSDGSVQVYDSVGANPSKWRSRRAALPDSILRLSSSEGSRLARYPRGGGRVTYDLNGQLRSIEDPHGNALRLINGSQYGKSVTLKIQKEINGGPTVWMDSLTYASGPGGPLLAQIRTRGASPSRTRATVMGRSGGTALTTLTNALNQSLSLTYGADDLLETITDPRGVVNTLYYAEDPHTSRRLRVDSVRTAATNTVDPAGPNQLMTGYWAASDLGRTAPADPNPDEVFARVDGPRDDVMDQWTYWLTPWGAPRKIRNPENRDTEMSRDDPRFPRLVSSVLFPNGRVVGSSYDSIGRLAYTTDNAVPGTTNYEWDNTWDRVKTVISPTNLRTDIGYDPATGRRDWQQAGQADSLKISFAYGNQNPALVDEITQPHASLQKFVHSALEYDAALFNLKAATSGGTRTEYLRDGAGQVVRTRTPFGTTTTEFRTDSIAYDDLGREVYRKTYSDDALAGAVIVSTEYDPATGDKTAVRRKSDPDPEGIGWISTEWEYDGLGRVRREIASDLNFDEYTYDEVGNVKTHRPRDVENFMIAMDYDVMGRLWKRHLPHVSRTAVPAIALQAVGYSSRTVTAPAEVEVFGYDPMGNLIRADNLAAKIRRGYDLAGRLVADTMILSGYNPNSGTSYGGTPTKTFVTTYGYDAEGRRKIMARPSQLSSQAVTYDYDPVTGGLKSITDGLKVFTYTHDRFGGLVDLRRPGSLGETRSYDGVGRMTDRRVTSPYTGWDYGGRLTNSDSVVVRDAVAYTQNGRIDLLENNLGTAQMQYSGLGHLTSIVTRNYAPALPEGELATSITETYSLDAMGNRSASERTSIAWWDSRIDAQSQDTSRYEQFTGRLRGMGHPINPELYGSTEFGYDDAGNTILTVRTDAPVEYNGLYHQPVAQTQSLLDANHRVMGVVRFACLLEPLAPLGHGGCGNTRWEGSGRPSLFEQHRYDALGRRVMTYTITTDPTCTDYWCANALTRTIWDGDQVAGEIRYPTQDLVVDGFATHPVTGFDILVVDTIVADLEQISGVVDLSRWECVNDDPDGEDFCSNHPIYPDTFPEGASFHYERVAPTVYPYGVVTYLHGPQIDQPLMIRRSYLSIDHLAGEEIMPLPNWKGDFFTAATGAGDPLGCFNKIPTASGPCQKVEWPGPAQWSSYLSISEPVSRRGPTFWLGSLVDKSTDASGLMYMRNRYYDPASGRFTQEDPIGIAGGLNLYGYANGDPINFSDPFGLAADTIFAKWHSVGLGAKHLSFRIEPEADSPWRNHPAFAANGGDFATIGAGPVGGRLVAGYNRDNDVNKAGGRVAMDLGGRELDEVIGLLVKGMAMHDNSLLYDVLPGTPVIGGRGDYNSNSFFSGLANFADLPIPILSVKTPGLDDPVPIGR